VQQDDESILMAKITVKDYQTGYYPNYMSYIDDEQGRRYHSTKGLVPYKVCLVDVCGFRFTFHSVMQIELCHDYFAQKIRMSGRLPVYRENLGGDHYETQRWFEKLPARLSHHSKRPKILSALEMAINEFKAHPSAITGTKKPSLMGWSGKD
jgi:hypothetical protein